TPSPTPTLKASSPSLAEPTSCPSASCTRGGNASSLLPTCSRDTVFTAVPPVSNDDFALATVATRPDEAGGPPPQVLRATGQPPLAAGDDRAQVVIDAFARHALQPLERARMPLEKRFDRHLERKEDGLRARVRQGSDE